MNAKPIRGQGALEYLLLIGGAVLVGTVVLLIAIGSTSSTTGIINDNIDNFTGEISLNTAFGGSTANLCGTASQFCAPSQTSNCEGGAFAYDGTQTCNSTCTAYGSCNIGTQACGDGIVNLNSTEVCDTTGNVGCSGGTPICNSCSVCEASGGGGDPVTLSGLSASPTGAVNGESYYSFSWTGNSLLAGLGLVSKGLFISATPSGTFPISTMNSDTVIASTPDSYSPPTNFTFNETSSPDNGRITNYLIKLIALPISSTVSSYIVAAADNGGTDYQIVSNAIDVTNGSGWTWPADTEAPFPISPTGSTGLINGGVLSFAFKETADVYLGTPVTDKGLSLAIKQGSYQIGACSTVDCPAGITDFSSPNVKKGTLVQTPQNSSAVVTTASLFSNNLTGSLSYTDGIIPSQTYHLAVHMCDFDDATTPGTSTNCTINSYSTTVKASKEAKQWEAETVTGSFGTSVNTAGSHLGVPVIQLVSSSCNTAQVFANYPVTLLAPASPNASYTIWVRGANLNALSTNRQNVTVGIGAASKSIQFSGAGASAPLVWNKTTVLPSTVSWPGGSQTVKLEFTSASLPSCVGTDLRIDKVLVTTDSSCDPNTATCT